MRFIRFAGKYVVMLGISVILILSSMAFYNKSKYQFEKSTNNNFVDQDSFNDLSILISSYDGYSELWPIVTDSLIKRWPDLEGNHSSLKIYLMSNVLDFQHPRIQNIKVGDSTIWSEGLLYALSKIKTKHVLLILDDYIFDEQINTNRLAELFLYHKEKQAAYTSTIIDHGWLLINGHLDNPAAGDIEGVFVRNIDALYRNNTQAAIWDVDVLRSLIKLGESAWEFEMKGNDRSKKIHKPFFGLISKPAISYINAVGKGYFCRAALKEIQKDYPNFKPQRIKYIDSNEYCYDAIKPNLWRFYFKEYPKLQIKRILTKTKKLLGLE